MRTRIGILTVVLLATGCHGAGGSTPHLGATGSAPTTAGSASGTGGWATTASATIGTTPGRSDSAPSTGTGSGAPSTSVDEIIVGTPTTVTLEALLPFASGKQRWTDQTYVLTGHRAKHLVSLLKAAQAYRGDAPAGCQPTARSTAIRVASAGRTLAFRSYCDLIWAGNGNEILLSPDLVGAVDSVLATHSPTTSRRAKPDVNLLVDFEIVPQDGRPVRRAPGVITVTQDGRRIGTKHVAPGRHLRLQVAPGVYVITVSTPGLQCPSQTMTVAPGPYFGTSLNCPTRS